MKKKNLLTLGLSCLMCFGGLALASCGETTYKVTVNADEGATVAGLNADQKYKANDFVQFTVQLEEGAHYSIDYVKANGSTLTPQNNVYGFGMPAQDVEIRVALKDAREVELNLSASKVEIGEKVTYTVKFGGEVRSTGYELNAVGEGGIKIDAEHNTIEGTSEGKVKITATVNDKTATADLEVVKSSKSTIDEVHRDAVTTAAKAKFGYAGKLYTIPSKVVAKGSLDEKGYGDIVIADNNDFSIVSANTNTFNSVNNNTEYYVKGDVSNYFGLMKVTYNSDGDKTLTFTEGSTGVSPKAPEAMDATQFEAFYQKAETASSASQSEAGNTYDNLSHVVYISTTAKVVVEKGVNQLKINGATHYLNLDPTSAADKAAITAASEGASFNIEGYLLGANTTNGYSKMILTKVTAVDITVNSISVATDKSTLNYGEIATLTPTVNPPEAIAQYGVTYAANPAAAVNISADGKVSANVLAEDTDVSITATCKDKTSEPIVIKVKAAQEGDVTITTKTESIAINGDPFAFAGSVVGHPEATLSWSSSDPTIASFEDNVLTGHAKGSVTVTATSSLSAEKTASVIVAVDYDLSKPISADIPTVTADKTYDQTHLYEIKKVSVKAISVASYGRYTVTDGTNDLVIYSSRLESSDPENKSLSYDATTGKWKHDISKGLDPTPAVVIGMKLDIQVYGITTSSSSGTFKNYYGVITAYEEVHAESFTVSPTTLNLGKGQSETIVVSTEPAVVTDKITFVSSDPTIASVDATGKVTGGNEGDVVITVTVGSLEAKTVNVHSTGVEVEYKQLVKYDFTGDTPARPASKATDATLTTFFEDRSSADKTKVIPVASGVTGSIYFSKGSGGTGIPDDVLKFGTSSASSSFTLTLSGTDAKDVSRMVITAYSWNANQTITVNGSTYKAASAKTALTITLDFTATKTFNFSVSQCFCLSDITLQYIG